MASRSANDGRAMRLAAVPRRATPSDRLAPRPADPPATLESLLRQLLDIEARKRAYLRRINVESRGSVRLIAVEDVCYFRSDSKYTLLATADCEALIRVPLKALLAELDPAVFWRVHRSTIVNVGAVSEVTRDAHGHTRLHLRQRQESLAVSDAFAWLFRQS